MFNVGERIKYFREKRGITINALANLAGISQSYLRELELGNKKPTVEYLEYICQALKISLVTFFDVENEHNDVYNSINTLTEKQQKKLFEFLESIK